MRLIFLLSLLISNSFHQNIEDDPTCNQQPIVNCNFGQIESSSSVTASGNGRQNVAQGRPGRIGPPGALGPKGQKGENGQSDDTRRILMQVQSQVDRAITRSDLQQPLIENITRALLQGYMELEDGWIAPFNGYQYKLTPNVQTWDESAIICQNWGGNLVDYGFRDRSMRILITRALQIPLNLWYFAGLTDQRKEGTWRWINGHQAHEAALWFPAEPNSGDNNYDCARFYLSNTHIHGYQAADNDCSSSGYRAICERFA